VSAERGSSLCAVSSIGVMREGPLHGAIKAVLARPGDRLEVPVGRFVIDLVRADGELVEVQTGGFGALANKLDALLDEHRVRIVHPVAAERRIVRVDEHDDSARVAIGQAQCSPILGPKLLLSILRLPERKQPRRGCWGDKADTCRESTNGLVSVSRRFGGQPRRPGPLAEVPLTQGRVRARVARIGIQLAATRRGASSGESESGPGRSLSGKGIAERRRSP
jgi:hypothetical protein